MKFIKTATDKEIKAALKAYEAQLREHPETIQVSNIDVTIEFIPEMLVAMQELVAQCDKEIAWHFTATRKVIKSKSNKELIYTIDNVYVPPQVVTGSTVDVDADKYMSWFIEQGTAFQGHGHSHVNMATGASGTDRDYQKDQLANMTSGFYIFLIMNKSGDINPMVYDFDYNIHAERDDVYVISPWYNHKAWAREMIKKQISTKTYTYKSTKSSKVTYYNNPYGAYGCVADDIPGQLNVEDYVD